MAGGVVVAWGSPKQIQAGASLQLQNISIWAEHLLSKQDARMNYPYQLSPERVCASMSCCSIAGWCCSNQFEGGMSKVSPGDTSTFLLCWTGTCHKGFNLSLDLTTLFSLISFFCIIMISPPQSRSFKGPILCIFQSHGAICSTIK